MLTLSHSRTRAHDRPAKSRKRVYGKMWAGITATFIMQIFRFSIAFTASSLYS